jgi:hypothetical protein
MNLLSRSYRTAEILALVLIALLPAAAARATVTATQGDTYVTSATPGQNFSTAQTLNVNPQSITLLRFNLTALPAGTTPTQIAKATLHLWVNPASPNPNGNLTVVPVGSDWNEPAVTYANKPSTLASPKTTQALKPGVSGYDLEVDVTEHVKKWLTTPAANFGLAITAATPAVNMALDSMENTATSHVAFLDITVAGGKTVAVCLNASSPRVCSCNGKLVSIVRGGSCQATADTGSCSAIAAGMARDKPQASCCVCAL